MIDTSRTVQTLYTARPEAGPMDTQGWWWGLADVEAPWEVRALYLVQAVQKIVEMAGVEAITLSWWVETHGHPIMFLDDDV